MAVRLRVCLVNRLHQLYSCFMIYHGDVIIFLDIEPPMRLDLHTYIAKKNVQTTETYV